MVTVRKVHILTIPVSGTRFWTFLSALCRQVLSFVGFPSGCSWSQMATSVSDPVDWPSVPSGLLGYFEDTIIAPYQVDW